MQYQISSLLQITLLNFKWQGDLRKRKNCQPKKKKLKIRIPICDTNMHTFFRIYRLFFCSVIQPPNCSPSFQNKQIVQQSLSPPFLSKMYIQSLRFGVPISLTFLAPSLQHLLSEPEQISTRVQIISPYSCTWPAETGWKCQSTGEGSNIQILLERVVLPLFFTALSHFRAKYSPHLFNNT